MKNKRIRFTSIYPEKYFADKDDLVEMDTYLRSIGFLDVEEQINSVEIPGAGNMNYVLRIKTSERSFILKQSRPWVEKYPSIAAPIDRVSLEALFFDSLQGAKELQYHTPQLYHVDHDNYVIIMEDLGDVIDFTYLYESGAEILDEDILSLTKFLSGLHSIKTKKFPANIEMRTLNHEHIFNFPFDSNNGFDLDAIQSGLSSLRINESTDTELVNNIKELGQSYLSLDGTALLHGDFYPGSWMKSDKLYVLDAEFCFVGPREFELGVFIAHMKMANQPESKIELILNEYRHSSAIDTLLVYRFAGVEILRRLLGVAQLPLTLLLDEKARLVDQAKEWVNKEIKVSSSINLI